METAAVEYLVHLRQNASQLRDQAREWGFSEEEINQCIEEALKSVDNPSSYDTSPKNIARKCFHYFRVVTKTIVIIIFVLIALLVAFNVVTAYHEPSERLLSRFLQPYGYQIFRTVRLVTLPIHRFMNISEFYDAECVVENPFFEEVFDIDCNLCSSYTNVKVVNASDFTPIKFEVFANTLKPVQLKKTLESPVGYHELREAYLKHQDQVTSSPYILQSTNDAFPNLESLFNEDQEKTIKASDNLKIHWESHNVRISVMLRTLFPRPKYIPDKSEVEIGKHVLIDGPRTATYELPKVVNTLNVYIQGSGHRRILLRPKGACRQQCNALLAILEPGDALMFHYDLWQAYAASNSDDITLGYLIAISI